MAHLCSVCSSVGSLDYKNTIPESGLWQARKITYSPDIFQAASGVHSLVKHWNALSLPLVKQQEHWQVPPLLGTNVSPQLNPTRGIIFQLFWFTGNFSLQKQRLLTAGSVLKWGHKTYTKRGLMVPTGIFFFSHSLTVSPQSLEQVLTRYFWLVNQYNLQSKPHVQERKTRNHEMRL